MFGFSEVFSEYPVLAGMGEWLITATIIFARIISFIHMAPIFSTKSINNMVRITFSLILSFIFFDTLEAVQAPEEGYFLPYVIFLNVVIGLMLGYTARVLFNIVISGGEFMDSAMGFSSAQMFDPASGAQTTLMGKFMSQFAIVIFSLVQGPERLIQGLYGSFDAFSLYGANFEYNIDHIIGLTSEIITIGFIIVSPIILTILTNDLVLGLISRASPQINAFQISFTIKPTLGMIVFIMILPIYIPTLINLFASHSRLF